MYRSNTFSHIMKLVDKTIVRSVIKQHESDKHSKGFGTLDQLTALIFAQLDGSRSLRDLEISFNAKPQMHYHWGSKLLKRSTLSDANNKRKNEVFKDIATLLLNSHSSCNKELNSLLRIFDSTSIHITARGSQWAEKTRIRTGRGFKVHLEYSPGNESIDRFEITAPNVNDITVAQSFHLENGKIYVFDRAYNDYNWWSKIIECNSSFVARLKKQAKYEIVRSNKIDKAQEPNVVLDQIIIFTNAASKKGKKNNLANKPLRLITVINPEDSKTYTFVSNLMDIKASQVAGYYKSRWSIELLFKWLKQNLKITKFLGESENAIKTQIYVAIITYMLINSFRKLNSTLFNRTIDLYYWIKATLTSSDLIVRLPNITIKPEKVKSKQLLLYGI